MAQGSWGSLRQVPVTTTLIVINVIVFIFFMVGGRTADALYSYMVLAPFFMAGRWYTLLTSMFMHGGMMHIFMNMISLYYMSFLERIMGSWRYLIIYLVSGILGGLFCVCVYTAMAQNTYVVGASGAIFGLFGSGAVILISERRRPALLARPTGKRLLGSYLGMLVINLFISLSPGIAGAGHLGGFVGGVLLMLFFYPGLKRRALSRRGRW